MPNKKILTFGSFDGLHDGHRFFIGELEKLAEQVIIVVASDSIIKKIKNKSPRFTLKERMAFLKYEFSEAVVAAGDNELGKWDVLRKFKPDIVAVGYDQDALKSALENSEFGSKIKIVVIDSFYPEKYKSSLMWKTNKKTIRN